MDWKDMVAEKERKGAEMERLYEQGDFAGAVEAGKGMDPAELINNREYNAAVFTVYSQAFLTRSGDPRAMKTVFMENVSPEYILMNPHLNPDMIRLNGARQRAGKPLNELEVY